MRRHRSSRDFRQNSPMSASSGFTGPAPVAHDRRTLQMCGEVRRTLDLVLSGECDDDVLRGIYVQSVVPAPDAAHLLVTVTPLDPRDDTPPQTILKHLQVFAGRLRTSVAEAINRRRAPDLMFNFAGPPGAS